MTCAMVMAEVDSDDTPISPTSRDETVGRDPKRGVMSRRNIAFQTCPDLILTSAEPDHGHGESHAADTRKPGCPH